ncbi:hypothetical protein AKJ09_00759 [Labilithrix luteola]|uniref:Uncharacterized protein n=1 Tax=Labilithrix luteola TaxID=1391654 RepID=A0A0K1PKP3_9BACT|nr:hypothetical protein [Labilithrix luteola]AKU94095.1 hypothetical protein AKJ09_00759 [Labilithrix luteola]
MTSALSTTPSPAFVAPAPPVTFAREPAAKAASSPASPPVQVAPRYVAPPSSRVEVPALAESEPASPPQARAASSEALAQGSITEEARLLREANRTLKGGDAEGALAILALHAERYPHGVLEPERSAVRVFALCEAGRREEARAAANAFRANHGASPLGARVEGACSAAKRDP